MEINYRKNDDCEIQIIYLGLYNQKKALVFRGKRNFLKKYTLTIGAYKRYSRAKKIIFTHKTIY